MRKKKLDNIKITKYGTYCARLMFNGQAFTKTFKSQEDAEQWIDMMKYNLDTSCKQGMTVAEAVENYILVNEGIFSPNTTEFYRKLLRNQLKPLENCKLSNITREQVQMWVGKMSKHYSPKSISNAHGFLSTLLKEYRPDFILRTRLPRKPYKQRETLTEEDILLVLKNAVGTKYELPIALAVFCGLRESEVAGLKWKNYDGKNITIDSAKIYVNGQSYDKAPKTIAGYRTIALHPYVVNLINQQERTTDYICNVTLPSMYHGFTRIQKKVGIDSPFRFHDLRHFMASAMLVSGTNIPMKYMQKRMGHADGTMLEKVYQHTIAEKEEVYDEAINSYFDGLIESIKTESAN